MLSSTPRGSFAALLVHNIPSDAYGEQDPDGPATPRGVYGRILEFRPGANTDHDPLTEARRRGGGNLRVRFTPTPELRTILHRAFAFYALVEVAAMVTVGMLVLWSEYRVVYAEPPVKPAPCASEQAAASSSSGTGFTDPCSRAGVVLDAVTGENQGGQDTETYQHLSTGLADGQALYVWAQVNCMLNTLLYGLNCAVGKYPLGPEQLPVYHYNRHVRSLRGSFKLLSMLWYGAGCFVVVSVPSSNILISAAT
jgi:hypothetical protein